MNLVDLIEGLSKELDLSKAATLNLYDDFLEILISNLEHDVEFNLPGLGRFHTKVRESYRSYNPQQKRMVIMPKKKVVQFNSILLKPSGE